jgi:hypothetical protein
VGSGAAVTVPVGAGVLVEVEVEVQAHASSATATTSAAHAGRPRMVFLRMRSPDILSSAICKYPHRWPSHHWVDGPDTCCDHHRMDQTTGPDRFSSASRAPPGTELAPFEIKTG